MKRSLQQTSSTDSQQKKPPSVVQQKKVGATTKKQDTEDPQTEMITRQRIQEIHDKFESGEHSTSEVEELIHKVVTSPPMNPHWTTVLLKHVPEDMLHLLKDQTPPPMQEVDDDDEEEDEEEEDEEEEEDDDEETTNAEEEDIEEEEEDESDDEPPPQKKPKTEPNTKKEGTRISLY